MHILLKLNLFLLLICGSVVGSNPIIANPTPKHCLALFVKSQQDSIACMAEYVAEEAERKFTDGGPESLYLAKSLDIISLAAWAGNREYVRRWSQTALKHNSVEHVGYGSNILGELYEHRKFQGGHFFLLVIAENMIYLNPDRIEAFKLVGPETSAFHCTVAWVAAEYKRQKLALSSLDRCRKLEAGGLAARNKPKHWKLSEVRILAQIGNFEEAIKQVGPVENADRLYLSSITKEALRQPLGETSCSAVLPFFRQKEVKSVMLYGGLEIIDLHLACGETEEAIKIFWSEFESLKHDQAKANLIGVTLGSAWLSANTQVAAMMLEEAQKLPRLFEVTLSNAIIWHGIHTFQGRNSTAVPKLVLNLLDEKQIVANNATLENLFNSSFLKKPLSLEDLKLGNLNLEESTKLLISFTYLAIGDEFRKKSTAEFSAGVYQTRKEIWPIK